MAVCRRVARDVHPRAVNDARLLRGVVVRAKCIWWSAMYCGSSSARCSGGSCSYCRVDSVGADHHLHVVTGVDGTTACARRSRRPTHATTSSSCGLRRTRCSSNPHCHVRQQYAYVIFNHPVKTHNLPRSLLRLYVKHRSPTTALSHPQPTAVTKMSRVMVGTTKALALDVARRGTTKSSASNQRPNATYAVCRPFDCILHQCQGQPPPRRTHRFISRDHCQGAR